MRRRLGDLKMRGKERLIELYVLEAEVGREWERGTNG